MKQRQRTRFKDFIVPNVPAYAVSAVLAVMGVGCGMVPYITVYRLLMRLAKGGTSIAEVSGYAAVIIAAFAAQLVLHSISTAVSHKTAFCGLEKIRLVITEKMMRMPLHPYTEALLSAAPIPDPEIERKRQRIILSGDVPSPAEKRTGCYFYDRCPKRKEACACSIPQLKDQGNGHQVACFLCE